MGRLGLGAVMLVTLTASTLSNGPAGAQSAANVPTLSTVEALTSSLPAPSPPAELVSPPHHDAQDVLRASATSDEVSRSMPRATFRTDTGGTVQCSGVVPDIGTNGHVPDESLCDLWQKPYRDRADAVVTLTKLNDAHTAKFGEPMCLTSGYRTLEEQAALRRKEPGLAAPAGLSNHGWGLAVDFCKETYTGIHGTWLRANAATYDWDNPAWARRGGSGPYEPWHWEYETGVNALVAAGLEK
ncbi:MAG: hypothetical protein BGO37_12815 [Cellulomonas sp. 73-92]|nr:MAG: hypothetical protein BGO37_12815 [Cellulomonas sp. 73-92]